MCKRPSYRNRYVHIADRRLFIYGRGHSRVDCVAGHTASSIRPLGVEGERHKDAHLSARHGLSSAQSGNVFLPEGIKIPPPSGMQRTTKSFV